MINDNVLLELRSTIKNVLAARRAYSMSHGDGFLCTIDIGSTSSAPPPSVMFKGGSSRISEALKIKVVGLEKQLDAELKDIMNVKDDNK